MRETNTKTLRATNRETSHPVTEPSREAGTFTRRIGSTTYRVGVRFSETSRETAGEKIARIIRRETLNTAKERVCAGDGR